MTFFGEVLPVVSRAVYEDENEELIPLLVWKQSSSIKDLKEDIEVLAIVIGMHIMDEIETNKDVLLLGTFYEQIELSSTETPQTKEIGKVYLDKNNPSKLKVSCIFFKNAVSQNSWDISSILLNLTCGRISKVVILESKPRALYQDEIDSNNMKESVIKVLRTTSRSKSTDTASTKGQLNISLEQPNVVGDLSAAVLTDCELNNTYCNVYLCYSDVDEGEDIFEQSLLHDDFGFMSNIRSNKLASSYNYTQSSLYT